MAMRVPRGSRGDAVTADTEALFLPTGTRARASDPPCPAHHCCRERCHACLCSDWQPHHDGDNAYSMQTTKLRALTHIFSRSMLQMRRARTEPAWRRISQVRP